MNLELCPLCSAIVRNVHDVPIWDTILLETANFLVTPSIGPLVRGHIMILSKEHHLSLASMPDEQIKECLDIAEKLAIIRKEPLLFSEHGSFNSQMGGACIEHTHIHVIPNYSRFYHVLDNVLPVNKEFEAVQKLTHLKSVDFPYILNFTSDGKMRLYQAYNAYSQMMRRGICNALNRPDWDWSKNEKIDLIKETIKEWKMLI